MKNWILSHKKTVAAVCVFAILIVAVSIFIRRERDIEAMKEEESLDSEEQTAEIEAWGEVKYGRTEKINIDFPSIVTDVHVKEGERVTLGKPLMTIDLSEYNGNIEKLKQQLSANQAALNSASQDTSALQADIAQSQDELARKNDEYNSGISADLKLLQNSLNLAQKELEKAKKDFQSYQTLYDEGAVSEATFNQYASMLNQQQKAVDDVEANIQKTKTALKDELDLLNVSLKSKRIQLSQLQQGNTTNVAAQQSSLEAAQIDLNIMMGKTARDYIKDNQVVSNVKNGIVKNIGVGNGSYLGAQGMFTEVIDIIDADSITVSAEVYEEFIESVHLGDEVRIVPASSPDTSLKGTVTYIPDMAEEKDGRRIVRVEVKPEDPDNILKPGFTADVYFSR